MGSITLTRTSSGSISNPDANLNNNWTALETEVNGNLLAAANVKVGVAPAVLDGNTSAEGTSTSLARADHKHMIQGVELRTGNPASGHFVGRLYFNTTTERLMVCNDAVTPIYRPVFAVPETSPNDGAVAYVASGAPAFTFGSTDKQTLRSVGAVPTWKDGLAAFDAASSLIDVVNTVSETSIYSKSIPGNTLGASGSLRLRLIGDYLNTTGSTRIVTVKVKFGGTIIYQDDTSTLSSSNDRRPWYLELILANLGATNAQHLSGALRFGSLTLPVTGLGGLSTGVVSLDSVFSSAATNPAIDTTATQTLDVTVQHPVANANLSLRRKYGLLELLTP